MGETLLPLASLKFPQMPLFADNYKGELSNWIHLAIEVALKNLQENQKTGNYKIKRRMIKGLRKVIKVESGLKQKYSRLSSGTYRIVRQLGSVNVEIKEIDNL